MQFTRMPWGAWSIAMARLSAITAPLDTEYGVSPRGRSAEIDEMLTMAPPPASTIAGIACLQHRKTLWRLTFRTWSHPSSVQRSTGP